MRNHAVMMLLALLAGSWARPVNGQNWCTPGATWWYDHWGAFGNQIGVVKIQHEGDTVILGELGHRSVATVSGYDYLNNMPYQFNWAEIITKSTLDQVSYWDGDQWHLLFNLAAGVGDQWVLSGFNFADRTVEVIAIGDTIIAGLSLRYSVVTFSPSFQALNELSGDTIIERIGFKRLFLDPNRTVGLDGDVFDLRCYQDDEVFYSTPGISNCDIQTGLNDAIHIQRTSLYPNPSSGVVTISALSIPGFAQFVLTDAWGRKVYDRATGSETTFDLSGLATGVYIYQFFDISGRIIFTGRWVKY